jgi:hypothetical protein
VPTGALRHYAVSPLAVLGYVHCAVNDYYYWTYNPWNLRKYKSIILLVPGLYASGPKKMSQYEIPKNRQSLESPHCKYQVA